MQLVHKPEGASEAKTYVFRPGRLRSGQASILLTHYRKLSSNPSATWEEFRSIACPSGDPAAKRLMLWHCMLAEHPHTKLVDVDPFDDELTVELDRAELTALRDQLAVAKGVDEGTREMYIEQIDARIENLDDGGDGGKASSIEPSTTTSET